MGINCVLKAKCHWAANAKLLQNLPIYMTSGREESELTKQQQQQQLQQASHGQKS